MKLKPKPSLEDFIKTCTPLLKIPALEQEMRERVQKIVSELLHFQAGTDPVTTLKEFLRTDASFLGVLLALTNLSQEKFLRILTAQRFSVGDYGKEWNAKFVFRKIKMDDIFAERIARLFLEGKSSQLLISQVADFYLEQLSLPTNWPETIRDETVIGNFVRQKLTGEYSDKKGKFVEKAVKDILDPIKATYGVGYAHGQVRLVRKEVDHAIPNLEDPYVLIMTSYMETTSSSQTARANEQTTMHTDLDQNHIRYGTKRVLVNIVDGAGWLARRSDLRKLHTGADYCLNINTLDQLEPIIFKHVPKKYFSKKPRPVVQED